MTSRWLLVVVVASGILAAPAYADSICQPAFTYGTGMQGLGTYVLTVTANSGIISPGACTVSVSYNLNTSGPVEPGYLHILTEGSADGDGPGGFYASATMSQGGQVHALRCDEVTCSPSQTVPFMLGVPFVLTASAGAVSSGSGYERTGGAGEISVVLNAYCMYCDPNADGLLQAQSWKTFDEVSSFVYVVATPEPMTVALSFAGIAMLLLAILLKRE